MKTSTIIIIAAMTLAASVAAVTPGAATKARADLNSRKEVYSNAALCSDFVAGEYAKTSPGESADRIAEAAVKRCACLWQLVADAEVSTAPAPYRDAKLRAEMTTYTIDLAKRETAAYVFAARAAAPVNVPQGWRAIDGMIAACRGG